MRIEVIIDHPPHQRLPINYQYLISSWIYSVLYKSNKEFATWLHTRGYRLDSKKYKNFCFSMLQPSKYKIHTREKVLELVQGPTELIVSFNLTEGMKHMMEGLFSDNQMELKSGQFRMTGVVSKVNIKPKPSFQEEMEFNTLTPICISVNQKGNEYADYLHPEDERYADYFASNLVDKANAFYGYKEFNTTQVEFSLTSGHIRSKLWRIKGIDIKGYLFQFKLKAPAELIELGFYSGFGVQNSSLGMGMTEIKLNAS